MVIIEIFGLCKGDSFDIHIWAGFGYFFLRREIRFYLLVKS